MKVKLSILFVFSCFILSFSQEKSAVEPAQSFKYLEINEPFDLLVEYAMVNPECATKKQIHYSIIIGTTVIGDYLERVTVLIPCLGNEFLKGDLIEIKPIKTPTKNIVYLTSPYQTDSSILLGAEFPAIWGEVSKTF